MDYSAAAPPDVLTTAPIPWPAVTKASYDIQLRRLPLQQLH
ncbi:hypothetical protein [Rudaeicoccus suwonensis]|nr:hypothetical protein [Rudaeicoccus suwonensis]